MIKHIYKKIFVLLTIGIFSFNATTGNFWGNNLEEDAQRLADIAKKGLPRVLNKTTTAVSAKAVGATLQMGVQLSYDESLYMMRAKSAGVSMEKVRPLLVNGVNEDANRRACGSEILGEFIEAGGTLEHIQTFLNGEIDMIINLNVHIFIYIS